MYFQGLDCYSMYIVFLNSPVFAVAASLSLSSLICHFQYWFLDLDLVTCPLVHFIRFGCNVIILVELLWLFKLFCSSSGMATPSPASREGKAKVKRRSQVMSRVMYTPKILGNVGILQHRLTRPDNVLNPTFIDIHSFPGP